MAESVKLLMHFFIEDRPQLWSIHYQAMKPNRSKLDGNHNTRRVYRPSNPYPAFPRFPIPRFAGALRQCDTITDSHQ